MIYLFFPSMGHNPLLGKEPVDLYQTMKETFFRIQLIIVTISCLTYKFILSNKTVSLFSESQPPFIKAQCSNE